MTIMFLDGGILDCNRIDYCGGDTIMCDYDEVRLSDVERIFSNKEDYVAWLQEEVILAQDVLLKLKDAGNTSGYEWEETVEMVSDFKERLGRAQSCVT